MSQSGIIDECRMRMDEFLAQAKRSGKPASAAGAIEADISQTLDRITEMDAPERDRVLACLTPQECNFLISIARDEAVCSVRHGTPERLYYGLLALVLEGCKEDPRLSITRLAMLYRSAEILGIQLEDYWFHRVKQFATHDVSEFVEGYLAEGSKDITSMGYREGTTKNGFAYVQIRE